MKSAPELFEAGWHAHKDTDGGHTVFIDGSLHDEWVLRYPGGLAQQLVEASEAEPAELKKEME